MTFQHYCKKKVFVHDWFLSKLLHIIFERFSTNFDIVDLIDPIPGLGQFHVNSKGYADAQ